MQCQPISSRAESRFRNSLAGANSRFCPSTRTSIPAFPKKAPNAVLVFKLNRGRLNHAANQAHRH